MMINSRGVALLLATAIALVTLAFTSLVGAVTPTILFVVTIISFGVSYILSQLTLDFLIFKEINNIYDMLDNLRKEEFSELDDRDSSHLNPLRRINQEIASYAQIKEKEIKELKRIEAFRREFLADISHELKTPIFAAQGFVHTLLDGAVKDKSVRKRFLKKAAKSLDGLNILVQELLTISQMEIGEIKMHPEHFNLYEVIMDVFDQMEGKSERKEVTVKFVEGCDPHTYVHADPQRIYQVMTNLISNAIKYNNEGGEVWVDLEVQENFVTVFVKDNGSGIPPEHIKR
ncbi:MAG: HAMP domain-containing sensor histidine kinase, partial [Bacteroidota bacterium]